MTKPTGRPLGRPVVYSDEDRPMSVSLRIPRGLADQAKAFAYEHRQTLTELLLDGLRWRIAPGSTPVHQAVSDIPHYGITALREAAQPLQTTESPAAEPFDERRYVLGALCKNRHEHGSAGRSLRYRRVRSDGRKEGACVDCEREKKARLKAQKALRS